VVEHSGRYANFAIRMAREQYATFAFDLRGHGRSGGRRGHIGAWQEYRDDLTRFLELVAKEIPGHPAFLFGHSMGALIVLDYVMRQPPPLKGAIVCGAPVRPAGVAKPYLVAIAKALSRIAPTLTLPLGFDAGSLSRDPAVVDAYTHDPLIFRRMTARWGTEALSTLEWVRDHRRQIRLPLLILHGAADRLNLPVGAQELFDSVQCSDKQLRVYPDNMHELLNDLDHDRVESDILEWLRLHL
jgi:alpha-beta hydrolase superfamily lysophospholipase